ncbi:MAG: alpha/beta fold hydrolase [Odoribacter sp.]
MKKRYMIPLFIIVLLVIIFQMGPKMSRIELSNELPVVPVGIDSISEYVRDREASLPVKPDNEGIIVWGDSVAKPTEYVLLYLHGFTASRFEGSPVTQNFVNEFKVNAYLPRLAAHGLMVEEPLLDMTPAYLYDSAKEALVIAHKLGEKVIVMGTSTGGTLALMLAADFPDLVDGLILYSPNIQIKNSMAPLLSGPWGLQISRAVHGGNYSISDDPADSEDCKYWYCRYRVEAQIYLQQLLDMRMNRKEFAKVHQPVFLGFYYKDADHQDQTIEVKAALRMFDELGTPADKKMKVAFPEAGVHVIACGLTSQAVTEVREQTFEFVRRMWGM